MKSTNNNNVTYSEEEMEEMEKMEEMEEMEKIEEYLETLNERCKKYDNIQLRKQAVREYKILKNLKKE